MQLVKVVLALAALALVPSEGSENRAATGLASKVAGLLRGNVCTAFADYCLQNSDCCSGNCVGNVRVPGSSVCF